MSQENVEIVRAGYEALNRADLDAWTAGYHQDAELHELATMPDSAIHRGHGGLRAWIENARGLTDGDFGFEVEEIVDAGDLVVVRARAHARGRVGGVPIDMRVYHVFDVDCGKIRRVRGFVNEADALAAVELSQ
jgi:ketosteroid isomerase-like protein